MLSQYIVYRLKARGVRKVHSPFLYAFYQEVMSFKGDPTTKRIDKHLDDIRQSSEPIQISGFGAGSRKRKTPNTIGQVAKRSGTSKRWGRFLYKLAQRSQGPVIELGTNLGIGTAYLASGTNHMVYTVEGCSNLSTFAKDSLTRLELTNVDFLTAAIQDINWYDVLKGKSPGLVYIDADHTFDATVAFYSIFKNLINDQSVIVIDDINWSDEMRNAWQEIVKDDKITLSVDLFFKGLLFFDPALSKQNIILK